MILSRHEGGVAVVSFNRPEARNALTPDMFAALRATLDHVLGASATRALLLTGEGKVFCGGFDLKLCLAHPGTLAHLLRDLSSVIQRLSDRDLPVVIAAHGAAIAGGCALLSAADVVVTNEDAKLGYPVTPLGISPAVSGPFMRAAVGEGVTRARQLEPALISGREATRLGVAHECVARAEEVAPRALAIANELASKPPGAFSATKSWLRQLASADGPPDAAMRALGASLDLAGGTEEQELLSRQLARS